MLVKFGQLEMQKAGDAGYAVYAFFLHTAVIILVLHNLFKHICMVLPVVELFCISWHIFDPF